MEHRRAPHLAATCWFGGFDLAGIPVAENDLAVDGRPISVARPERCGVVRSIAVERRQAITWLAGTEALYSEVGLNT